MMVCSCGGSCTSSDTKDGAAYTCRACGRREVVKPMRLVPPGRNILNASFEERTEGETMDLFENTVKNLLTMPPMPKRRNKP